MKNLIVLFLIMISLGAAAYLINQATSDGSSSVSLDDRAFAFEDKGDISKIVLQKVGNPEQIFTNNKGDWYINDQLVGDYKINTLLKGITSTRVENLPPRNGVQVIYDSMKKNGVNVKVYDRKDKLVRSYTVGPDATNDRCTYFLMEGKKQPYCMNISGFGSLRTRFIQDTDKWRDIVLFRTKTEDIASLKMEYNKDYTSSFEIKNENGEYTVEDIGSKTKGRAIDVNKVTSYLSAYRELYGEGFDNEYRLKDSIRSLTPFATVTLKTKAGDSKSIRLFPLSEMMDPTKEVLAPEDALRLSSYFVDVSDGDFMMAQQRLLQPIFRPYDYFLR